MAADQGFTGFMSDFAKVFKENSVDIIDTTKGIETLFSDTLEFLADEEKLDDIVAGIRAALDSLLENLENGEILNADEISSHFEGITEQIKTAIGIDLDFELDSQKIFQSIKDIIPDNVFPPELEKIRLKVKEFFENVDLSDVQISVKGVTEPVPKPSSTNPNSSFAILGSATIPSNFDVFGPQTPTQGAPTGSQIPNNPTEIEGLLDKLSKDILGKFLSKESLIDGIMTKMEKAVIASGFYIELQEKREAFIKNLTSGGLSIPKLFEAIGQLVIDLIGTAVRTVIAILDVMMDDLKTFLQAIKGLTSIGPGSIVESIFEQIGVQNFKPGILSLPAFLISIPYTLITKAITGSKPEFPDLFQDATTDTNNKVYGAVQIIKSVGPFFGLASDKMNDRFPKASIVVGIIGDLFGPTLDIFGQLHSEPLHPNIDKNAHKAQLDKFFGYRIWEYQWFYNIGWSYLTAIINGVIAFIDYEANAPTPAVTISDSMKNRLPKLKFGKDIILSSLQVVFEIIHLGLFIKLFVLEQKAIEARDKGESLDTHVPINDPRTRNGYMLDAIPGIAGGIISIVKTVLDFKLEPLKKSAETTDEQAISEINRRILGLSRINGIVVEEKHFLEVDIPRLKIFHGLKGSNQDYGDLGTYLNLITTGVIQPSPIIREALQRVDEADSSATSKRLTKAVRDALDKFPDVNWANLIQHHKNAKSLLEDSRGSISDFMVDLLARLNSVKTGLNSGNLNTIQTQIQILEEWKIKARDFKSFMHQFIHLEVRKNKLLGSLFRKNGIQESLVSASQKAQITLSNLTTRLSLMNESQPARQQLATLQTQKNLLEQKTDLLIASKNRIPQLLRLFPNANAAVHHNPHLFPPLEIPKQSLDIILTELSEIKQQAELLGVRMNQSDIRNLEKSLNVLTGIDIIVNLGLQLAYGSLYVNTGVDPGTP